uniref:Uncharacterized protein n=1 Tax=Plectus sambesii TaxID=2011161 RepID=A0A914VSD5_9BILA
MIGSTADNTMRWPVFGESPPPESAAFVVGPSFARSFTPRQLCVHHPSSERDTPTEVRFDRRGRSICAPLCVRPKRDRNRSGSASYRPNPLAVFPNSPATIRESGESSECESAGGGLLTAHATTTTTTISNGALITVARIFNDTDKNAPSR